MSMGASGFSLYPPSVYFPNIKFNNDFYAVPNNGQGITLNYANTHYLFSTGSASSSALTTFFSGSIGIGTPPTGIAGDLQLLTLTGNNINALLNLQENGQNLSSKYLTQVNASNTFLTIANASSNYQPIINTYTISGATGGSMSFASGTLTLTMPTSYTSLSIASLTSATSIIYKGFEISAVYDTISARNVALTSYSTTGTDPNFLLKTGGTMTGSLSINTSVGGQEIVLTNTNPATDVVISLNNNVSSHGYLGIGGTNDGSYYANNMFLEATNSIVFNSGNYGTNPKMILLANGNVGIGTNNPNASLELYSTTQLQPRLILSGQEFYTNTAIQSGGIALLCGVNRSGNRQLWIADSANLTQNTTNPVLRIFVNAIDCVSTNGLNSLPILFGNSGATTTINGNNILLSGGNVGIGNPSPTAPLWIGRPDVASSGYIVISQNSSGNRNYKMGFDANFNFVLGDYGNANGTNTWTSQFLINYSAPANSLSINNKGNVNINNALTVGGALTVNNTTTINGTTYLNGTTWVAPGNKISCADNFHYIYFNQGANILQLQEYGTIQFSIGPSYSVMGYFDSNGLTVSTIINVGGTIIFSGAWLVGNSISPNGVINSFVFQHRVVASGINSFWWFNGTQTSTSSEISDERIKKNIQPVNNALSIVNKLQPRTFDLIDDKDVCSKYGFISQEVEAIPELSKLIFTTTDFICNINSYGTHNNTGDGKAIITANNNINGLIDVGDNIKLVFNNNDKNNLEIIIDETPYKNRYKRRYVEVLEIIDDYSFVIDKELTVDETDPLFIYGKEVNDFKHLDYQSFHALNTSAIQELYKMIQAQQQQINLLLNKIN